MKVFKISLKNFETPVKLYNDNAPTLLNLKEFSDNAAWKRKEILQSFCHKKYIILLTKRSSRQNTIDYVALDFQTVEPKTAK